MKLKMFIKKILARVPDKLVFYLYHFYCGLKMLTGRFISHEPEFKILDYLINPGDWVVDIGANIGYYTKRMSDLVGEEGRVIAFEPVPRTFSLLAVNLRLFKFQNVTLINTAASDCSGTEHISIPKDLDGVSNFYLAHLSASTNNSLPVMKMALDPLFSNFKISLIKVDTEGHEAEVIHGLWNLIRSSLPTLIIEYPNDDLINDLKPLGYIPVFLTNSPNVLFLPGQSQNPMKGKY